MHKSHAIYLQILWKRVVSHLKTTPGGHLVIGVCVITPKGVKSHIPWLWATKQIHFIGTIKCFISKQTCTDVNVRDDLNERFIFNFAELFLIHHWFVPWMNRKGHNQFWMLHLFIYISSFQYQTQKWCDWYLLNFESGIMKYKRDGATNRQYFLIWSFINTSNHSVIWFTFQSANHSKLENKSLSHSNHALWCL